MRKILFWGGMCALLLLPACTSAEDEPDAAATIEALKATIVLQQDQLATLEAQANQPTPIPPTPSPTPKPHQPTVVLLTPKPEADPQVRPPTATPSPLPTATPTATATATPIPDAAVGETLTNLRSGPAVGFAILAEVEAGTPLVVLGKSADNEWFQVRTPDGLEGWMYYLPVQLNIPVETIPITG